jgi:toxin ParE1/3/4
MARVLRTSLARADLKAIARYVARESQSRDMAIRFLEKIESRCQLHATQPQMGEARSDLGAAVRQFSVGNYLVFFRPIAGGIELLRVLHAKRDVPVAWRIR